MTFNIKHKTNRYFWKIYSRSYIVHRLKHYILCFLLISCDWI